jgi:hypothetical protein
MLPVTTDTLLRVYADEPKYRLSRSMSSVSMTGHGGVTIAMQARCIYISLKPISGMQQARREPPD